MLVKFFATYREVTDCRDCDVAAPPDVLALLKELSKRWPEFSELLLDETGTDKNAGAIVLVNGRHIDHTGGVQTPLSEADYVALTPAVGGG